MKLFYLDIETTGVKYWRNGIHQISGAIEIDGEVMQTFDYKVKPYDKAVIEDEALAVSGITREDLNDYAEFRDVYEDIVAMLGQYVNKFDKKDKFFIVGYNCKGFDVEFFRAFFVQNGDDYFGSWFWSVPIDAIVLAQALLSPVRASMTDFKLHTVAAKLGIPVDSKRLHDAAYDIELTREVFRKCVSVYSPMWTLLENGFAFESTSSHDTPAKKIEG